MIQDAWIVGQKELCGIRRSLLPSTGALLTFIFILVLFGVVVPVGLASGWLNTTAYLFLWFWLAWLLTAGPISDSFAGERERHTLDALFATRLSCCAILVGKITAVTLYGLMLALVALVMSALITNASVPGWSVTPIQPIHLEMAGVLTLLSVLLASTAGALISLKARTARQAHQAAIIVVPAIMLIGLAVGRLASALTPATYQRVVDALLRFSRSPAALTAAGAAMALFTVVLFILAAVHLQRCRVVPS